MKDNKKQEFLKRIVPLALYHYPNLLRRERNGYLPLSDQREEEFSPEENPYLYYEHLMVDGYSYPSCYVGEKFSLCYCAFYTELCSQPESYFTKRNCLRILGTFDRLYEGEKSVAVDF